MPVEILLGPLLRRVTGDKATVWVQTDGPATVAVTAGPARGAARTFSVFGLHYALVTVTGLPNAASTPYQVSVDGRTAWPPEGYRYPGPVIRTARPGAPACIVFGSCREASPYAVATYPPDALDAYAVRLADLVARGADTPDDWPDLLMLLGDQVYADQASPPTQKWLHRRRERLRGRAAALRHRSVRAVLAAPPDQVIDFVEYDRLYRESWTDPEIRWLLSTVPSAMVFDDHEIIDDWNTSASWRTDVAAQPWWPERITAGLASYWVYQHLGNLEPDALAADPVYQEVTGAADGTAALRAFAAKADADRTGYRWSYALTVGRTRVVVLDNRCGRQLERGARDVLADSEWRWLARAAANGPDHDHLVIGASLPWLLPPSLHDLEAWNERMCDSDSPRVAAFGERLRRALDLEHWPAFGRSFEALAVLISQLGAAGDPAAPATIGVLSGDVHHSYVARATYGARAGNPDLRSVVYQAVCSPVHNKMPRAVRPLMDIGWSRPAERLFGALARRAGVPAGLLEWERAARPYFGNAVGTLCLHGRTASVAIEGTRADGRLVPVLDTALTSTYPEPATPSAAG